MKHLANLKILMAVFAASFVTVTASAEVPSREVVVPVNEAFIPSGFDSESDVYVIASGIFPNGCYRWNRADVEHDFDNKVHSIKAVATVSQGMCLMVLVPFTNEISLGQLGSGNHKIRFMSNDGTYMEKTLEIE